MGKSTYKDVDELPDLNSQQAPVNGKGTPATTYKSVDELPDLKKKDGTVSPLPDLKNGTSATSQSSSTSPLPSADPTGDTSFWQYDVFNNPLNTKAKPIVNVSGIPVKLNGSLSAPIPLQNDYNPEVLAKELQERIDSKTYLPEDVDVIANSMQVSKNAAAAFIKGDVGTGQVIHYNDIKEKQQDHLKSLVTKANEDLGLQDTYEGSLSTPEMAGAYIKKIDDLYKSKSDSENLASTYSAMKENPSLFAQGAITVDNTKSKSSSNAAQEIKKIVTNDIIDKVSVDNTLTKDQKVSKIYQLSNATDQKNVDAAIADRMARAKEFGWDGKSGNTNDVLELLNSNRAGITFQVNQKIKEQLDQNAALKSSFIEEYNSKVADGTINANDETAKKYFQDRIKQIDANTALIKPQYSTDKEIFKQFPVLQKAAIAKSINDYNAIKSGNVEGYENLIDFNRDENYPSLEQHLINNGFDPKSQEVKDVINGNYLKDYSFFGRPGDNILDVFTNSLKSLGDITGARDQGTVLAEKKQAEIFPTQVGSNDEYKLTNAASVGQNIGNTTGQIIGQGLLQYGTLGAGRMMNLSRVAATNTAFWTSGALTSYDQAYKDSYDFIDNDLGRMTYAGLIALSNSASEGIFKDVKLFQIPGIKDEIAGFAKRIGSKEFNQELTNELARTTMGNVKKSIIDYSKHAAIDVGKETVEEVATQLFEDGLRYVSGDPNANFKTAMENAKNTAIQTATGMAAIAAYGAHKSVREEKNTSPKATVYNAQLFHDESADAIQKGYQENLYSEDERNEKLKTLNTAVKANQTLIATQKVTGTELSRPKKELYVANLTAEALLTEQMKNSDDVLLQKSLEEKVSNLQSQRQEILDGKVDIDEDGNINISPKTNQNEKGNVNSKTGNVQTNDEAGAGTQIIGDQAQQDREKVNSNTGADQSASVNEKIKQVEVDRAADLESVTDDKKIKEINSYYDTVASNLLTENLKQNATQNSPQWQQQTNSQQSGEQERSRTDASQQGQAGQQTEGSQSNSSNSNLSSEEETVKRVVAENPKLVNNENATAKENVQYFQEQALSTPNSFNNEVNGNEELTTDLIARNSKKDINDAIKYQTGRLANTESENDITEIDKHIKLLEKGLAKKDPSPESVADKRAKELLAKNKPNEQSTGAANKSVQPNEPAEGAQNGEAAISTGTDGKGQAGSASAASVRPVRNRTAPVNNNIAERNPIPAKIKTEENANEQGKNEVPAPKPGEAAGNNDTGEKPKAKERARVRGTRKENRDIKHPEQLKALQHEVSSPVDHVLRYFIGGGKVNASALEKIFGNKRGKNINGEVISRVDLLNKTAPSLSEVAHKIWEGLPAELQDQHSSQDIENAVESVLTDFTSRTKMAEDLNSRFGQAGEENNPDQAYSDWLNQAYDTTGSEEAVNNAIDIVEPLTDEEAQRIIDEDKEGQQAYADQLTAQHEETKKVVDQQQAEKDKLGQNVDTLKTYLDKLQHEYDKQKAALAENGKQDQGNLFGGTKAAQMLFKNNLSEQGKIVADIKQQLDNVKDLHKEAKERFDNAPVGSMPLFSTKEDADEFQTNDNRPVSVDLLQAAYPDATIVQSQSDLPADIQAQAEGKTVEGVLHNGKVYMVADNIANMGRAEGVYKHETIGHAGVISDLKGKLGKFASDLVNNATGGQRSAIDKLSQKLFKQPSTKLTAEQKSTLGQEYIAQAAEKSDSFPTTWQKIVSFVRDFLRDRGIKLSVSEKDIKVLLDRAAKNVSSSTTGTRFSIAGEKANLDREVRENLNVAREMEKAGKSVDEIYHATGWEKSEDGKYRYEIPDITLNMEKVGKSGDLELKDMIQPGSELLKAYPELKNTVIRFVPNMQGYGAYSHEDYYYNEKTNSYEENKNIIDLNTNLLGAVYELKSTLIHEIQHAIQRIEGFESGGNVRTTHILDGGSEAREKLTGIIQTGKHSEEYKQVQNSLSNKSDLSKDEQRQALRESAKKYFTGEALKAFEQWDKKNPTDFEAYKRLAGEVEARNVQTRANLSETERKATPLYRTEDVAKEDQIKYYSNDDNQQSVKDDDFARHMQEMLRAARENAQLPESMPEDLKNYANDIIDFLKTDKKDITADEVIADMAQDAGTQFSPAEAPGLYKYVRDQFDADHQQAHQQNQQQGQAAPQPAGQLEDKSKLSDVDREVISKELEKKLSEVEFPNQFDMNEQLKQVASKTQSSGQDRVALDGNYVQAHLEDLRQISLITAKSLETALGAKWKNKVVQFLEERPNAGNVAQVAGIMNVISTDVFNEIAKARSGAKISELQDLQARVDRLAYDNARSASLALNQRRLYQDFAIGRPVSDILSEVILTPEQQQLKQAAEEALKQKFSDAELNKKTPKAKTPKAATSTTTTKPVQQTQSKTVKDDLVAKGKTVAQNSTLADKLQQVKDALKDFKC